ncbi:MAG: NAD(P)-dependent oxidoreductase [Balneolaceae bacterium]
MSNHSSHIIVTGANGFIGKHLVKHLTNSGKEVVEITHSDGDIRTLNLSNLRESTQVIHLANRNFIPDSWEHPGDFFSVNIDGTLNMLEQCWKSGARIIYVSAYVYGQPKYLPIDESHSLSGLNPYMKSKILTEELVRFYADNFMVPYAIIRPFNIYGAGQSDSFLIPTIARQIADPKTDTIQVQSLSPKRDFLHLHDFNNALEAIIDTPILNDTYNIGFGKSYSVEEIINTFFEITGKKLHYSETGEKRTNEVPDVVSDNSKISNKTGWKPNLSLKDGLSLVLESY